MRYVCHFVLVLLSFISLINNVNCAKILAIVPTESYSHQITFWPIWKALSSKGHQITLITTNPDPLQTNITQIDISFAYKLADDFGFAEKLQKSGNNFINNLLLFVEAGLFVQEGLLSSKTLQDFLKDDSQQFDLIFCEIWDNALLGIVHKFQIKNPSSPPAPFIALSSLDGTMQAHECVGNLNHPILYPEMLFPSEEKEPTFIQKITMLLYPAFYYLISIYSHKKEDELIRKYIGGNYPPMGEIRCNMDMLFVNTNFVFNKARPVTPATISIGGGIHLQEKASKLPKDLQDFLDSAKQGAIYFSLGSNVKSKDLTDKEKEEIMGAFKELPYKVLWKFEADELPGKPANVKLIKWAPQQDVLRHPNVKLFITQGGIQSIDESLFNHVPMVVMPFFGDQHNNAKKLVSKGIALEVDHFTIQKDSFKETILEVITNPIYKETVVKLSQLALDQPMTGVEKAVWWTEYVIRHKGAKHLKGQAAKMPLYQYLMLDVIGFLLAVLTVLIFIIYKTTKLILRKIAQLISKITGGKGNKPQQKSSKKVKKT